MTKNRKHLKQTPWIPGNPLHSRPGWYKGRWDYDAMVYDVYWDGNWWRENPMMGAPYRYGPTYFRGVSR